MRYTQLFPNSISMRSDGVERNIHFLRYLLICISKDYEFECFFFSFS